MESIPPWPQRSSNFCGDRACSGCLPSRKQNQLWEVEVFMYQGRSVCLLLCNNNIENSTYAYIHSLNALLPWSAGVLCHQFCHQLVWYGTNLYCRMDEEESRENGDGEILCRLGLILWSIWFGTNGMLNCGVT